MSGRITQESLAVAQQANRAPERWSLVDRSRYRPTVWHLWGDDGDAPEASVLITNRAHTSYLKIVDFAGSPDAKSTLLGALKEEALRQGIAALKWEDDGSDREFALDNGFEELTRPHQPSEDVSSPRCGYVLWTGDKWHKELPFYRQTTDFTCGSCAALIGQVGAGVESVESITRENEMLLWRNATNFPACEPVGLAVAIDRRWASSATVYLDHRGSVFLSHRQGFEREWRERLQLDSRLEAEALGIAVHNERLTIDTLSDFVGAGNPVLLLISLQLMHDDPELHWVTCHAAVGDCVVLEDPWTETEKGDTWVDAHELAVSRKDLDRMSLIEEDVVYRGAVCLWGSGISPEFL